MSHESTDAGALPYGGLVKVLGLVAGLLMALGTVSGVAMLVLKWVTGGAPHILSVIPLLVLPVAFVALLAALFFTLLRRRAS